MELGPVESVYIYKPMERHAGYRIIKENAQKMEQENTALANIKQNATPLWLLRESNVAGMLTIDYIYWENKAGCWAENSIRMALTSAGWIDASDINNPAVQEALKSKRPVTAQMALEHKDSLSSFIGQYHTSSNYAHLQFMLANRQNPGKEQQSKSAVYSGYTTVASQSFTPIFESISKKPTPTKIILDPALTQAITCDITGKPFKDPVVLIQDCMKPNAENKVLCLKKGRSYEKSALLALGIENKWFYDNFTLNKIIDRLGANDVEKLQSLTDERLLDNVLLETYIDPYILPSGHSFSKCVIDEMVKSGRTLQCPNTREKFEKKQAVQNVNLKHFIFAWPASQEKLINHIEQKRKNEEVMELVNPTETKRARSSSKL